MEWEDMAELREKLPRLGPIKVRWFAGFTVTIRLLELATIMSVTWWKEVFKTVCQDHVNLGSMRNIMK